MKRKSTSAGAILASAARSATGAVSLMGMLALMPGISLAATLPIGITHGTPGACSVYEIGGAGAVFIVDNFDWPEGRRPVIPENDAFVLVEPDGLVMQEYACDVASTDGLEVEFRCEGVGEEDHPEPVGGLLTPVDGGFDLKLAGDEPFRIIPCEKPTS